MSQATPPAAPPPSPPALPDLFYVDASAWVKLYLVEAATPWMRRFWASAPSSACATLGLVEVMATVVRRNSGANVPRTVTDAILAAVRRDYAGFAQIHFIADVLRVVEPLPRRHAMRGADSVHLGSALYLRQVTGRPIIMIASDLELLRAARLEGLTTLDPSTNPPQPAIPPPSSGTP